MRREISKLLEIFLREITFESCSFKELVLFYCLKFSSLINHSSFDFCYSLRASSAHGLSTVLGWQARRQNIQFWWLNCFQATTEEWHSLSCSYRPVPFPEKSSVDLNKISELEKWTSQLIRSKYRKYYRTILYSSQMEPHRILSQCAKCWRMAGGFTECDLWVDACLQNN